jgi:hypothetical protein
MLNNLVLVVGNMWFVCALVGLYYTASLLLFAVVWTKPLVVRKLSTFKSQLLPQPLLVFNRLFFDLSALPTGPISNNNYLYKLITIKALEKL